MDGLIYDQFEFDLFFDDKLISLHNSCIEKPSFTRRGAICGRLHTTRPIYCTGAAKWNRACRLYQDVTSTLHDQSDIFGSEIFENLHGIDVLDAVEKSVGGYVTVAVEPMLKPATLVRIVE